MQKEILNICFNLFKFGHSIRKIKPLIGFITIYLQSFKTSLTIFTGKKLCFTEFSTKINWGTSWLLLKFFIYLHNQLSSFNSIVIQMSEKHVGVSHMKIYSALWRIYSFACYNYNKLAATQKDMLNK